MHPWRNWNTRQTKDLVSERACEFESHRMHQNYASVAQQVEQWTENPRVASSTLA